jgi:GGDEF domain-containing protein
MATGLSTANDQHANGNSKSRVAAGPTMPDTAFAERLLATEFAAALRGRPLTVVLFHIDELEKLTQIHGVSQESLIFAAHRAIKRHTRAMHLTVRVEKTPGTFLSILSEVGPEGARVFVERARNEMASIRFGGKPIPVSVGVASFNHSMSDPSHLIKAAETALNRAIARGGNRVVVVVSRLTAGTA